MYDIIKSVINSGDYELESMITRIDRMYIRGKITEEEADELIKLARENVDELNSIDIAKQFADHEKRIRALEDMVMSPEHPEVPDNPDVEVDPEFPQYVSNVGYINGDKVTFNGKHYVCTLPDYTEITYQSPYSYPNYWKEVA